MGNVCKESFKMGKQMRTCSICNYRVRETCRAVAPDGMYEYECLNQECKAQLRSFHRETYERLDGVIPMNNINIGE